MARALLWIGAMSLPVSNMRSPQPNPSVYPGRIARWRVFVVDSQSVVRAGFRTLVRTQTDFEHVGDAEDSSSALAYIRLLRPDVAVVEAQVHGGPDLELLKSLKRDVPATHTAVFTAHANAADVTLALEAGAAGYLLKSLSDSDLFAALRLVAHGRRVLPPGMARESVLGRGARARGSLSPRELQVVGLLARGCCNRAIAKHLCVSEATIKTHVARICGKLGQVRRTAAVLEALRRGLIAPAGPEITRPASGATAAGPFRDG